MMIKLIGAGSTSSANTVEVKGDKICITTDRKVSFDNYSVHRIQCSTGRLRVSFEAIYIGLEFPSGNSVTYIFEIRPDIELFFRDYISLVIDNK